MKRYTTTSEALPEQNSFSKKKKLSKEEKKLISKENQKQRRYERKKESQIKDVYDGNCEYYFEDGLRKVFPYHYTFRCNVKERWIGRTILDVFTEEFYSSNNNFVIDRIEKKYLLINDMSTSTNYCLRPSDIITHTVHRHELPVLDDPVRIVSEDSNFMVINKPSSIPIHSTGKYHFNTVLGILSRSYKLNQLRVVHRLDRMTSGILIFGHNYESSRKLSYQISQRQVSKYYLAVVNGKFYCPDNKPVQCDAFLGPLNQKIGLFCVMNEFDGGKAASTRFTLVSYNPETNKSLVLCKPFTGRTHQIRIHLQYLGYPIINDPLYNSSAWGPDCGKGGIYHKSKADLIQDLESNHDVRLYQSLENGDFNAVCQRMSKNDSEVLQSFYEADCIDCQRNVSYSIDLTSLILYLHAFRYRANNGEWDFSTDLPKWAVDFNKSEFGVSNLLDKLRILTNPDSNI